MRKAGLVSRAYMPKPAHVMLHQHLKARFERALVIGGQCGPDDVGTVVGMA